MVKPADFSKFRNGLTKSIKGISTGFSDPIHWISTGNYTLNYLLSGDFYKGVPLGKVSVFAGESGSGKSYICAGNMVRNAQKEGAFVVLLDTENALDESWLHALDVDTSEDKLLRVRVSMIDDIAKIISEFVDGYRNEYSDMDLEDQPQVVIVIDSLGMTLTPTDVDQFQKGDMKGDMGRKAKALTALVRNTVNLIAPHPIGLVCTNHTYASQDMFDPDDKITGGQGFIYASSMVVAIRKLKLKEDEDGKKVTDVRGIRASCKVMKTRYSKPFESVQIKIPYSTGMDPYSGLFELFESTGKLIRQGNRYRYITKDGDEIIEFKKNWSSDKLDVVMSEFSVEDLICSEDESNTDVEMIEN